MKYLDAHCHLTPDVDLDTMLSRAAKIGVDGMLCNAAQFSEWDDIINATRLCSSVHGAIGIHPWHISHAPENWATILQDLLHQNPELSVGEIGLDKNYPDIDAQQDAFVTQLNIAYQLGRGVSVHCVGLWDRLFDVLRMCQNKLPRFLVLHSYSGPAFNMEKSANQFNLYYSYGPRNLLMRRFSDCVTHTPLSRLLIESDGSNPSVLPDVLNAIARELNLAPSHLSDIIYSNSEQIF